MEPTPAVAAAYEAALPDDPRVQSKKMFGMPCAFVNRQMFFGIFNHSVIARLGAARVAALLQFDETRYAVFTPTEGSPWRDYVQVEASEEASELKRLAAEALAYAVTLPPKGKKPKR